MTADHIKEYWESQGHMHGESHWASWGDNWAIDLEIETIGRHLKDGDHVLDVGCGNGFGALRQWKTHRLGSLTGIDFATNMIAAANAAKARDNAGDAVRFAEGDVKALAFPDNHFDATYTTRVLINLPTWAEQKQGIAECLRVTKPGGLVVLSEGFWEPLMLLNAMRQLTNLPPLVEHDFNRYLKRSSLEAFLQKLGLEYEFEDFSSIYYLGSRLVRELVTDPTAYPGFTNPINRLFYEIERQFSGGGMGVQQAVIVHKAAAAHDPE